MQDTNETSFERNKRMLYYMHYNSVREYYMWVEYIEIAIEPFIYFFIL